MCTLKSLQTLHKSQFTGSNKLFSLIKSAALILGVLILFSWFSVSLGKTHYISFSWILTLACILVYMPTHMRLAIATAVMMAVGSIIAHFIAYPAPSQSGMLLCIIFLAVGFGIQAWQGKKKQSFDIMATLKEISMMPILLCYELLTATNLLSQVGIGGAKKATKKAADKPAADAGKKD